MPLMMISVCVGVVTLTPLGIWCTTGCEKPSERFSLSPCACARKPTPTSARRFSKPWVTPSTMFATSARMVPDMAFAWFELPSALNSTCSPSFFTSTFGSAARAMVPSGPFTAMLPAPSVTSTPCGRATGYLAMRDMGSLYATMQSTSPPRPSARALRSVITPREVETMATPRPFITRGMSSRPL